jgi:dCTP deaminase
MAEVKGRKQRLPVGEMTDADVLHAILNCHIVITPLISRQQVGATVDLRLGTTFRLRKIDNLTHFDPIDFLEHERQGQPVDQYDEVVTKPYPLDYFVLHPQRSALGETLEYISLPEDISGTLEGRSGWARVGLNVHSTASFIHPTHNGPIVLELTNVGSHPLPLYPGTRVAQLRFTRLHDAVRSPYKNKAGSGKYAGFMETNPGRPWEDVEFETLLLAREQRRARDRS